MSDALTLRYLDGDGHGCAYPGEVPSRIRQRYHHFTFYGFLLCGAATTAAAFYHHVLGWEHRTRWSACRWSSAWPAAPAC